MKVRLNNHKKIIAMAGLLVVGAGIGASGAVFATIPNTLTAEISACRDNAAGGLRVVDEQAGQACATGETMLRWSGAQSAVASFDYLDTDPMGPGAFNATKSRNVAAHKSGSYDAGNGNDYGTGICLHLDFVPRFESPSPTYSIYSSDGSGTDIVQNACGNGYEYYLMNSARISYYFSE